MECFVLLCLVGESPVLNQVIIRTQNCPNVFPIAAFMGYKKVNDTTTFNVTYINQF